MENFPHGAKVCVCGEGGGGWLSTRRQFYTLTFFFWKWFWVNVSPQDKGFRAPPYSATEHILDNFAAERLRGYLNVVKCNSKGLTPNLLSYIFFCYLQWRIQDFPELGRVAVPTYDFAKFSPKLHEIERMRTGRGASILQYRSATDLSKRTIQINPLISEIYGIYCSKGFLKV